MSTEPAQQARHREFVLAFSSVQGNASKTKAAFNDPAATIESLTSAWNTYNATVRRPGGPLEAVSTIATLWKIDDRLYPTWTSLDDVVNYANQVDDDIDAGYRGQVTPRYKATEASITSAQVGIITSLIFPGILVALVGPAITYAWARRWKAKMVYWGSYSTDTKFLHPTKLSVILALVALGSAIAIAIVVGGIEVVRAVFR